MKNKTCYICGQEVPEDEETKITVKIEGVTRIRVVHNHCWDKFLKWKEKMEKECKL